MRLYPYGTDTPLDVAGTFQGQIACAGRTVTATFVVVTNETSGSLLGRKTAGDLGLFQLNPDVNVISPTGTSSEKIVIENPEVFNGVGKLKDFQLKIHADPTVRPVAQPPRRIPFHLRKQVAAKVEELERLDIIEPAEGPTPWVSPLVVVPKSNGEIRVCVDMRQANLAVERERHPIPTIEETLQEMKGASVFSKLDLRWGYHQIELEPESRKITTFATHKGLFRYKRLMFGLTSAPEIYQHVIQQTLHGCPSTKNISDDIIVHGKDHADDDANLQKTLQRIKEKGLTLNKEKCVFGVPQLTFFGSVVSADGVAPDGKKVEAIKGARAPSNAAEVRSFLGLVNYYGRFIPNFATIADPLRQLTKKGTEWAWTTVHQTAFNHLKGALTSDCVMAHYNPDVKTQLRVDASPVGLGAILTQCQHGETQPVAYASRTLSDVERRYSQTEKEALAVVWGCEKFHLYLYGTEFELYTDHKPLEVIYDPRAKSSARVERWVLRLQPYRYKIIYTPGKGNPADMLSRFPIDGQPGASRTQHCRGIHQLHDTACSSQSHVTGGNQVCITSRSRV